MSSKAKWKDSFRKAKTSSQTSLGNSTSTRNTSLLEDELSVSDDELQQYLGTIRKKSGLNRLWTGNTFDRVIDRTPDVSISSVSDGEVPIDEEDKNQNSDNDFLPNIMALPSLATENNNSEISEPSSIKPFQAVHIISDLELSDDPLEVANNVKLAESVHEPEDQLNSNIKSVNHSLSSVKEVQTLDEISEEIEEDLSENTNQVKSSIYSNTKKEPHRPKHRKRSEGSSSYENEKSLSTSSRYKKDSKSRINSRQSRSISSSKYRSQHTSEHSSLKISHEQNKTHSGRRRHSQRNDVSSKSNDSYTSDFSESSRQTKTESSKKSNRTRSTATSLKVTSLGEIDKKKTKHRMNEYCRDVATQVNLGDISGQKLGVGMATLGPSLGHHYVDPSPIARHVVSADAVEAVSAYNPAVIALTDMLRQQLRLVEQFVDNSRRMYESYTNNLNTTYKYTTLEDTLQYIEENRNRQSSP